MLAFPAVPSKIRLGNQTASHVRLAMMLQRCSVRRETFPVQRPLPNPALVASARVQIDHKHARFIRRRVENGAELKITEAPSGDQLGFTILNCSGDTGSILPPSAGMIKALGRCPALRHVPQCSCRQATSAAPSLSPEGKSVAGALCHPPGFATSYDRGKPHT